MVFENVENIISLLCTIVGLLYCVHKYIETPRTGYRYIIGFFLANFLSEYFWTIYQLVMHDYPDVSEFAAYLGWNIGYLCLLISVFHLRSEEERKTFHPLMILPVIFTVPQFLLYIRFGGFINNLWQVGVTTITMVLCIQPLAAYAKNKEKRRGFPWYALIVLIFLIASYGMWTASCFDWPNEWANPYFYCTVIGSVATVFLAFGAGKFYSDGTKNPDENNTAELRFRFLTQVIVSFVIVGICAIGFFMAFWLKNTMEAEDGFIRTETQFAAYLFAISVILIFVVLLLLSVISRRYRSYRAAGKKANELKQSRNNFIFTIVVTLLLMVFAGIYNNVILYNSAVVGVYEDAKAEIKSTATELESYLTVAETTLRVSADSVGLMEQNGNSISDMKKYIVDQTTLVSEQFDENFTGIYAYIDGVYLDGLNWVPPEGYEPTERDWYKAAVEADGEVVIVSPYVDAQTGSVVITIGKSISDSKSKGQSKNVVCLDVIVNHIQEITQEVEIAGKGYGMVINSEGFIMAHKDDALNGENIAELYDEELLQNIINTESGSFSGSIDDEVSTIFVAPVMDHWYTVIVIENDELLEETNSQLAINIMVSFLTFCLITFFYYIGYKNEQIYSRKVEEMNIQVVSTLATAIDAKDRYTNGHSTRVAEYSKMIAARAGLSRAEQDEIYMIGLLHDVGKIGVPDSVINKPSSLTKEEYEKIKEHPVIGSSILATIKDRPLLSKGARWHHERYDGNGYPDGLAGEEIPMEARIIAVADAYDAMTSKRSYRDVMSQERVRSEIANGAGSQFDPRFAEVMIQMIDEDKDYSMREN